MKYLELFENFNATNVYPTHDELSNLYWFKELQKHHYDIKWITGAIAYKNGTRVLDLNCPFYTGVFQFYPKNGTILNTKGRRVTINVNLTTIEGWDSAFYEIFLATLKNLLRTSTIVPIRGIVEGKANSFSSILESIKNKDILVKDNFNSTEDYKNSLDIFYWLLSMCKEPFRLIPFINDIYEFDLHLGLGIIVGIRKENLNLYQSISPLLKVKNITDDMVKGASLLGRSGNF